MRSLSFWKPDPIPENGQVISKATLRSLGRPREVCGNLLSIPSMSRMDPWNDYDSAVLLWERGQVTLSYEADETLIPGEVVTINVRTLALDNLFFSLFVQVFERFETTLLWNGDFMTPQEFKLRR